MDARSHQSIMSYSNNGFVEQEPVLYPPGAYGSGTPSLAPTVCDRRIMDPIEMEMNEMSFVGSSATSAGYMGLDRRRMNARNQNIEQRSGLIENLRRYVGQNMLGLNENQDDDIQEISVNTQDGMGQGRQEIRNRNGETMWWDQERISEDRSSTSTDYQPMPAPRLQPVAQSSPTSNRRVNEWVTGNGQYDSGNLGPGIFHTTAPPNQGPINLGHFEPRSFGFLNDPMNLRNQQPTINQPTLFSSRNQMPNRLDFHYGKTF